MLISCSKLDTSSYQQYLELAQRCKNQDKGTPLFYDNLLLYQRNPESNWLVIENERCMAIASVYFFYDEACEVSLMVDPESRRKGVAKQLLTALFPQLHNRNMQSILFTVGTDSPFKSLMSSKGLSYKTSEYHMRRLGYDPRLTGVKRITVRPAILQDVPMLCQIDDQCFSHRPEMIERFTALVNDPEYSLLVAEYNHHIIGKAHIQWHENESTLSDIAILPLYQGQGFGGELLAFTIEKCLKEGRSFQRLDVETSNENALKLYQQFGFQTYDAHDYWQISLDKLKASVFIDL